MSVDLARTALAQRLLAELYAVADRLLPNEREMAAHLRAKYAEPGHTDRDDVPVLQVILRNVKIRGGFDIDPARDPGRVIPVAPRR